MMDKMGDKWFHPSVHSAVQHCIRHRATQERGDDGMLVTPQGTPALRSAPMDADAKDINVNLGKPVIIQVDATPKTAA